MSWMFGKRNVPVAAPPPPPAPEPSLKDQIKQNRRKIDRACREMDRERLKLEAQERKVNLEIKRVAGAGQIEAARILAKDLARTRAHISKMYQMRTQMQSISMQMTAMSTQEAMAGSMANVVQMMTRMNRGMNLPAMQKVIMSFEMEQGKMEMTSEMMDDALGDMAGVEESAEADRILQEVLAEQSQAVQAQVGARVPATTTGPVGVGGQQIAQPQQGIDEIMEKLGGPH